MDRLKLVVPDGHADQRIDLGLFVQESLPIGKQIPEQLFSFGRRVNQLARFSGEHRTGALRTRISTPRILLQTSSAVRVVSGSLASDW